MRKILICLITFICVFAGTTACVVFNGYVNYEKEKQEAELNNTQPDNTVLTSLADNVLNSEYYTGDLLITNKTNTISIIWKSNKSNKSNDSISI